jgi:hypothetical protein
MSRLHVLVAVLGLTAGCYRGAVLTPASAGCYALQASSWSETHTRVTGLRSLPGVVALDTSNLGQILVPRSWIDAEPQAVSARLRLESQPWWHVGDSLITDWTSPPHWLRDDSLIVVFRGWGGSVVAYLARDAPGFVGTGFLYPRDLAKGVGSVPLRLTPGACPRDLVRKVIQGP